MTGPLRQRLKTVQLVSITAFDDLGRLRLDPMRIHVRRLFEAGIRCFIPCAGSAEFDSLDEEEIVAVVEMMRDELGQDVLLMSPTGRNLDQAIRLTDKCAVAGADCGLVMPLAFPYLADAGARDYFVQLLDASPVPLLFYKKGPVPSDALLLDLEGHPRFCGVKYAVNDLDAFQTVVRASQGDIGWYCGTAERFAPYFMLAGAEGYTSGAGNLCPQMTLAMHRALAQQNWAEAFAWQQQLLPIEQYRARGDNSYNVTFLKHAVKLLGLDFGRPRPPQRSLTAEEEQEIENMMPEILEAEARVASSVLVDGNTDLG